MAPERGSDPNNGPDPPWASFEPVRQVKVGSYYFSRTRTAPITEGPYVKKSIFSGN